MTMFLESKEEVYNVEWGRSWLWDVRFEDRSLAVFNKWFPATSVTINKFALEAHEFSAPYSTFSVPKGSTLFDLKINFLDDVKLTIEKWASNWVNNEIFGNNCVATLERACKRVTVVRYTQDKDILDSNVYHVFPRGSLYFEGSSENSVPTSELEFVIAGTE